jgi:hypothetical protein
MEAEHIEGASKTAVKLVEGNHLNGSGDDRKARFIGRSRCRSAFWLARWAVTADDIWQQDGGNVAPHGGDAPTTAMGVLAQPLLDCGQGKNPPQQDKLVVSQQKTVDSNDGVAAEGTQEDGNGVRNVSNKNNGCTQGEACDPTGRPGDVKCDARETTTVKKSMHGAPNPHLNRESVPPSDTSLPQCGDQLPARELTPPTNSAHSPLSEEEASNEHVPPPPADIHLRACQRHLGTHANLVSSNIPIKSTSVPCPITLET